ncbi:MAG: hypothetical protein FJ106_13400 [Deltaproteobacteria bacterium]|nr:hypothetical protein [Deltaproteobacteria bacterium]
MFKREVRLEEIQSLIEKVKSDLKEERPEGEIVQSLLPIMEEGSEMAGQVVEELGNISHPLVGRVLQHLLENPCDKKIRKMIKRSLYRLKSKGIAVEEVLPEKEGPVFRPLQAEPPRGFGGPFDFLGRRFLMLNVPHIRRGLTVMQGIVGDMEGLVDFSGGEMPRKRFKEFFEEVQRGGPFPLMEMEPSYVGFLFAEANRLTLDEGRTPPREYLRLKKEVEGIKKEHEKSPAYSCIQEDEIEGNDRLLGKGGDLLKTDLFDAWRIKEEEIRPYADEVWEAEESKLILNQAQKEARFQEIYQRALSDLFPEEKRSLYRRRMEEMAYYLFRSGKEEEARVSLAVAVDLKKVPNVIQPNPFLFQLVVKSIFALLKESYEKKVKEPSFIVKP